MPDNPSPDPVPTFPAVEPALPGGPPPELVQAWEERHTAAAADFMKMLLGIRGEGAQRFNQGTWGLWQAAEALDPVREQDKDDVDPTANSLYSLYHLLAELAVVPQKENRSEVGAAADVSQRWLMSFEAMARLINDEHSELFERQCPSDQRQAEALKTLITELGRPLSRPSTDAVRRCRVRGERRCMRVNTFGLGTDTAAPLPDVAEVAGAWAVLPLVWLPIALYVRSTTHLYEMLERLQQKAVLHRGAPPQAARKAGEGGAELLRELLDRDERRYSYLVFCTTAALQALHLARQSLGRQFPLALLGSSPPDPARGISNGYPMQRPRDFGDTQAIFRGVWVGAEVDEERARFQYSFQSFSQQVEGMNQVLSFYASIDGNPTTRLAMEQRHILVLVGRVRWHDRQCLAMPVQLLDGPRDKGSECEVLLPAYVRYRLEDDLAVSSADFSGPDGAPSPSAETKLAQLKSRWEGFELPGMLLQMLGRQPVGPEFPELDSLRPFVSVRFIRSVSLPEPLCQLFDEDAASNNLYDFDTVEPPSVQPKPPRRK